MADFVIREPSAVEMGGVRAVLTAMAQGPLPKWESIASGARVMTGRRDDSFPNEVDGHSHVSLVMSGLLRLTADGGSRPRTLDFIRAGAIFAPTAFLQAGLQRSGHHTVAALGTWGVSPRVDGSELVTAVSDSAVFRVDGDAVWELADHNPQWSRLMLRLMVVHLLARSARLRDVLTLSAEERYVNLLTEEPEIARQAVQSHLASHLGVSPEALSRIAARARTRLRSSRLE